MHYFIMETSWYAKELTVVIFIKHDCTFGGSTIPGCKNKSVIGETACRMKGYMITIGQEFIQ